MWGTVVIVAVIAVAAFFALRATIRNIKSELSGKCSGCFGSCSGSCSGSCAGCGGCSHGTDNMSKPPSTP